MSRIVDLDEGEWAPHEKGARFFSYVAYPDEEQQKERERFWKALCRFFTLMMASMGENMNWSIRGRAAFLVEDPNASNKILAKGLAQLQKRITTTHYVAMPHLRAAFTGVLEKVDGLQPTVGNMLDLARWNLTDCGWKPDSDSNSTAKTKLWKPTRPVVHAAAAFLVISSEWLSRKEGAGFRMSNAVFLTINNVPILLSIMFLSELFRFALPSIKNFKITEDESIRFLWGTPFVDVSSTDDASEAVIQIFGMVISDMLEIFRQNKNNSDLLFSTLMQMFDDFRRKQKILAGVASNPNFHEVFRSVLTKHSDISTKVDNSQANRQQANQNDPMAPKGPAAQSQDKRRNPTC